jgi:SagB-type dehydrogenase family enzyme
VENWSRDGARRYHEATKHTRRSVRDAGAPLDWANRPNPFKEYVATEARAVPEDLSSLLAGGAGVVRTKVLSGGPLYSFRTYSSAGALYPIELYVAAPDLGLCHFHPRELTLRQLRREDVRANIAEAAADASTAEARAVLVLTGILERTAWKYGERGYRHLWWDAGTMLANLLALAPASRLLTAFVDDEVNRILGVDGERETALAVLALGKATCAAGPPALAPLELEVAPLSHRERTFPLARLAHQVARLGSADEVARYRGGAASRPCDVTTRIAGLEDVLRRRGSTREFSPVPMPANLLARVLARSLDPVPADAEPCNELLGIVNNVEGLARGAYRFHLPDRFHLLRTGDFRRYAGALALDQQLGTRSAGTFFFMADLDEVVARLGNRGYRWAQLEAGIRTGRVYLHAVAEHLGATASTFYDDEVSAFFARELSPMLCVAVGRRRESGPR